MDDQAFASYRRMSHVVLGAQAAGLAVVLLFSLQTTSPVTLAAVASVGIMIAVAGFATGGLFGFVFGIPRSLQEPTRPPATTGDAADPDADERAAQVHYAGNTSLEQISDWLTKIIVGVGLTQLANLPGALGAFGELMGPPLGGFPGSTVLAPLELVFFGIGGFFLGYLWTRLYLMSLYVESDEAAQREDATAGELTPTLLRGPWREMRSCETSRGAAPFRGPGTCRARGLRPPRVRRSGTCCGSMISRSTTRARSPRSMGAASR